MEIFPAIDLLDDQVVRLVQGDKKRVTVYSKDPVTIAKKYADAGAHRLHLVDLSAAFGESGRHLKTIEAIARAIEIPIEVGGGIRTKQYATSLLNAGASYLVLGTVAITKPAIAVDLCSTYPKQIIVAVDAKDGIVAAQGWTQSSGVTATELATKAVEWGAGGILYTDIARDGTHSGPNVDATSLLHRQFGDKLLVIASGGVSSIQDLHNLHKADIPAVIVGKALYDNKFSLDQAIEAGRAV